MGKCKKKKNIIFLYERLKNYFELKNMVKDFIKKKHLKISLSLSSNLQLQSVWLATRLSIFALTNSLISSFVSKFSKVKKYNYNNVKTKWLLNFIQTTSLSDMAWLLILFSEHFKIPLNLRMKWINLDAVQL